MIYKKQFTIDMYSALVRVFVADDLVELRPWIDKNFGIEIDFDKTEACVFTISNVKGYFIAFDKRCLSHNTIAHEVFHLTKKLATDRDIHEEESQAWIAGYCSETLYNIFKKKKFIVK